MDSSTMTSASTTFDATLLDTLEEEHREVERMLDELSSVSETDAQRALLEQVTEALVAHMKTEEAEVYPLLSEIDSDKSISAEAEHALVRGSLETLESMVGAPGFMAALDMLKAGIEHHVVEEEQQTFQRLREHLGAVRTETRDELYERARRAKIPGRSAMTRDELAKALGRP